MVADAADFPWSSYRHNALGETNAILSEHPVYTGLGPTPEARQKAYRILFDEVLDDDMLASIRDATQRGWVSGSDKFRDQIAAMLGRGAIEAPQRGRPRKSKTKPEMTDAPRLL